MSRIEKGLHEHHARLAEQAQNNSMAASQVQAGQSAPPAALEAPFAKVNSIVAGSPADEAGLKVGDSITKFGWVDWTNHDRLGRVAEAVSQNEGVSASSVLRWRSNVPNADNSRSPSRSKLCDLVRQVQRRLYRCSLRRGGIGADEACWAATCCHCEVHHRSRRNSMLPKLSTISIITWESPEWHVPIKHGGGCVNGSRDGCRVAGADG
jgi:hypothetical protein